MQEEPRLVLVSSTAPRQSPASSPEANSKLLSRCISSNNSLAKPPSSTNLLRKEPGTGRDLLLWHRQLGLAHATWLGSCNMCRWPWKPNGNQCTPAGTSLGDRGVPDAVAQHAPAAQRQIWVPIPAEACRGQYDSCITVAFADGHASRKPASSTGWFAARTASHAFHAAACAPALQPLKAQLAHIAYPSSSLVRISGCCRRNCRPGAWAPASSRTIAPKTCKRSRGA